MLADANGQMERAKRRVDLADLLKFTCDRVRAFGVSYTCAVDADGRFTLEVNTRDIPPPPTARPVPATGPHFHTRRTKPMTSETSTEALLKEKGLTAPRVTPEQLDAVIEVEDYQTFPGSCLTVCVLTLVNGFTVTGESACASPENFNKEIGRSVARDNARQNIWSLEGYLLKQRLYDARQMSSPTPIRISRSWNCQPLSARLRPTSA